MHGLCTPMYLLSHGTLGHKAGRVSYSMKSTLEKAHFKDTVAKRLDKNMYSIRV